MTSVTTRLIASILFFLLHFGTWAQQPVTSPVPYSSNTTVNYVRTWQAAAPETNPVILITRPLRDVVQSTGYFDGLGRPLQIVVKQGSLTTDKNLNPNPSPVDLVSPVVYDELGREVYKYLPFAANNTNGNTSVDDGLFKLNPFQQQATFATNQYPGETFYYGQINYEVSPLNRITETFAPGNSWVGTASNTNENDRHSVKAKYLVNTINDKVRKWTVDNVANGFGNYNTATGTDGTYPAGTLYKNVTSDEHDDQVIEFKDKEGLIILKKVQLTAMADDGTGRDHSGWLCSYYIYDDLNQLRAVIQPAGVELLVKKDWDMTVLNEDFLNEQCFRYEYDERRRMIIKKAPGAGEVYMVYDVRDRLVFTQDANLRAQNQWLTTLYDDLNRPVITGLITYAASLSAMQQQVTTQTTSPVTPPSGLLAGLDLPQATHTGTYSGDYQALNTVTMNDGFETTDNAAFSATLVNSEGEPVVVVDGQNVNKSPLPVGAPFTVLTTTYYDNYNNIPSGFSTTTLSPSGYTAYLDASGIEYPDPLTPTTSVTGLVTGTKVKVLGEDRYITTCNLYDEKKRVIQEQTINYSGAMDIVTNQYSFSGQLLRSHIKHQKGGANPQSYDVATKNTYDDLGRIASVEKNLNGSGWKQIAAMSYDALGQLTTKKFSPAFNSNAGLETLTCEYNIRGWILGANRDYAKSTSGTDHYFGFDLGYDKQPIASLGSYAAAQYSGNIAGAVWKSKGDGEIRKYDFSYDAVNRLSGAGFTQYNGGFNTTAGVDFSVSNLTYDANGNIKTMDQMGLKIGGSSFIDQLRYTYQNDNSNKLQNVMDISNDPQTRLGDFRYSDSHPQKDTKNAYAQGPLSVDPTTVTDYSYDANGNMNVDKNKDITSITYSHLNLPQTITIANKGSIDYTYDATGLKLKKIVREIGKPYKTTLYLFGTYEDDVLQFLPQEEGRIRPVRDDNGTITSFTYDYFLKDHLGNVRMVLIEEQQPALYPAVTFEGTNVTNEQLYYENVDVERVTRPNDFYNADANGNEVQLLRKNTQSIGAGKLLKVMATDKLHIKVDYYTPDDAADNSNADGLSAVITQLFSLLNSSIAPDPLHGNGSIITTDLGNNVPFTDFLQPEVGSSGTTKPKAYLNILFFDEQFKFVPENSEIIPITTKGSGQTITRVMGNAKVAPKNGYAYIYVSNESNNLVYFDNLQITHEKGPILEETHYYPFGLTMAGISSKRIEANYKENKYKFNGIEQNTELDLNQYDAFYRTLDPQTGRFWQIDPQFDILESYSPYESMDNNPVNNVDPLGDFSGRFGAWLYRLFNGGGKIGKNEYGEWYVEKTRTEPIEGGNAGIVSYRYYGKGRNQYTAAGEEIQAKQEQKEFEDHLVKKGVLVRTTSLQEAKDNTLKTFTSVLLPNILKIGTVNTVTKELPNAGPIMKSLGAASKAEMLARKLKLNINSQTTRQVLNSLEETVESFITKFRKASIKSELPGEFLDKTVEEALLSGNTTVRKLLIDSRFVK